ncbi:hypothetical protein CSUI_008254, partial [Cystoisospora suis]
EAAGGEGRRRARCSPRVGRILLDAIGEVLQGPARVSGGASPRLRPAQRAFPGYYPSQHTRSVHPRKALPVNFKLICSSPPGVTRMRSWVAATPWSRSRSVKPSRSAGAAPNERLGHNLPVCHNYH